MKKAVIAIVVIIVIVLLALWYRGNSNQTAMDDSSFETEAAAILSQPVPDAQKVANLNANLQARLQARQARASKTGAATRVIPGVTTK